MNLIAENRDRLSGVGLDPDDERVAAAIDRGALDPETLFTWSEVTHVAHDLHCTTGEARVGNPNAHWDGLPFWRAYVTAAGNAEIEYWGQEGAA
jgi:hypothetical protein